MEIEGLVCLFCREQKCRKHSVKLLWRKPEQLLAGKSTIAFLRLRIIAQLGSLLKRLHASTRSEF